MALSGLSQNGTGHVIAVSNLIGRFRSHDMEDINIILSDRRVGGAKTTPQSQNNDESNNNNEMMKMMINDYDCHCSRLLQLLHFRLSLVVERSGEHNKIK